MTRLLEHLRFESAVGRKPRTNVPCWHLISDQENMIDPGILNIQGDVEVCHSERTVRLCGEVGLLKISTLLIYS